MRSTSSNPITDRWINDVLDQLHARARREVPGLVTHFALEALKRLAGAKRPNGADAKYVRDKLIPIGRGQGWLIYMLCPGLQARRVVEFGTSYGVSTLYLAAAMRDQGGGLVIGTEIEPEKARHARNHFVEAGVADLIELREGDALVTLKDCGGPVDFLLVDGFPKLQTYHRIDGASATQGRARRLRQCGAFSKKLRRLSGLCPSPGQRLCFESPAIERRNRAFCENLMEACSESLRQRLSARPLAPLSEWTPD